jgi:hypothetical protein
MLIGVNMLTIRLRNVITRLQTWGENLIKHDQNLGFKVPWCWAKTGDV